VDALLVVAPPTVAAALAWTALRLRTARLLALRLDEARRLERLATRVRELAETAGAVGRGERPREAFSLAQLRLAESLAALRAPLPDVRRLLLLEPEHAHRVRMQARAALAEVTERALETEIDRDAFAWARRRGRSTDARIDAAAGAAADAPTARRAA
jgi:hypothetical protein